MSDQDERRNKRIGILTSVGIHGVMVVLFLFVMGWTAPDPPLSDYGSGVELNFGLDDQGTGDVQSYSPAGQETQPVELKQEESVKKEEAKKEDARQETEKVESNLTSKEETSVEVKEDKKEIKKPATEESKGKDEKKVEGKKEDSKGTQEKDTKKVTDAYSGKTDANGPSEGDDPDKTGNKGKPEGTLNPDGLYTGKPGTGGPGSGGNGFGLAMEGWAWDKQPEPPSIPDNVNGRITFKIEVDADGEIVAIEPSEQGLSPEAVKICKEEILKRSFVRTGGTAPHRSKGTITFILKVK